MNESIPNREVEQTTPSHEVEEENHDEKEYSLQQDEESWAVVDRNGEVVPVDSELGKALHLALRVQEKVDELHSAGKITPFLERYALMNCRKTAWLARHPDDLRRMTRLADIRSYENLSKEEIRKISGITELKREMDAMISLGTQPIIGTGDDLQIKEYLNERIEELPAIVHVFNTPVSEAEDLIEGTILNDERINGSFLCDKMRQDHTFIVLGQDSSGRYICFHKGGAGIHKPFEIVDFNSALSFTHAPEYENKVFASMVGPLDSIDRVSKEVEEGEE